MTATLFCGFYPNPLADVSPSNFTKCLSGKTRGKLDQKPSRCGLLKTATYRLVAPSFLKSLKFYLDDIVRSARRLHLCGRWKFPLNLTREDVWRCYSWLWFNHFACTTSVDYRAMPRYRQIIPGPDAEVLLGYLNRQQMKRIAVDTTYFIRRWLVSGYRGSQSKCNFVRIFFNIRIRNPIFTMYLQVHRHDSWAFCDNMRILRKLPELRKWRRVWVTSEGLCPYSFGNNPRSILMRRGSTILGYRTLFFPGSFISVGLVTEHCYFLTYWIIKLLNAKITIWLYSNRKFNGLITKNSEKPSADSQFKFREALRLRFLID